MAEKKKRDRRYRDFATVVYEDSAPEDWYERLQATHLPCFVVEHNKDTNPDGTLKKAHNHVMVMYDSVHSLDQAKELFSSIGGVGCEVVQTKRGMARYLCHLDNPEKHQYDIEDVYELGGADYLDVITNESDNFATFQELVYYVKENGVEDVTSLFDMLLEEDSKAWLHFLYKNVFLIDKFCSANYKRRVYSKDAKPETKVIDLSDDSKVFCYRLMDILRGDL